MKKMVLAVMAVAAIGLTSCGNKTQQAEAVDSVAIVDSLAGEAAQGVIDQLGAQLQAGDAAKEKIAELLKENPEVAKEYVVKVQNYLKENADKVKEVVGDNAAVAAAVTALTDIDPESVITGVLEKVGETATEAKDAAVDAATGVKDAAVDAANKQVEAGKAALEQKANEVKDAAKKQAEETKEAAKKQANDAVDNAAKEVKKGLGL